MSRPPAPLRNVVSSFQMDGAGGLFMAHRLSIRWWELTLECGHRAERSCKYEKGASGGRRGFAVLHHPAPRDKMLPAPKRVRCEQCLQDEARAAKAAETTPDDNGSLKDST